MVSAARDPEDSTGNSTLTPAQSRGRGAESLQVEVRDQEVCRRVGGRAGTRVHLHTAEHRPIAFLAGSQNFLPHPVSLPPPEQGPGSSWERPDRPGQTRDTHLVIPTADAELATQTVGAGAVIHTRAVLGGQSQCEWGAPCSPLPKLSPPQPRVHVSGQWLVMGEGKSPGSNGGGVLHVPQYGCSPTTGSFQLLLPQPGGP